MAKAAIRASVVHVSILLVMGLVLTALFPAPASALPGWARKYDTACATCHYPAPPRLNAYGHKFRRAQYRMEDEFNKDADWGNVGNYIAMRVRGRYDWDDREIEVLTPADDSPISSSFSLHDATLFYAGPISKHFSGFVELERPQDGDELEAVVSVGGIRGSPDRFGTFRIGQFHTLTRVGFGGLDRPTGISTPSPLSLPLVSGNGFKLNQDQVGVEGTYVWGDQRIIGQVLNGSDIDADVGTTNAGPAPTTDRSDQNTDKDFMLAYELMWGETASGLTVFLYDGTQDDQTSIGPPDEVSFQRYGVTAAQVWDNGFEVQGGYIIGSDDFNPATTAGGTVGDSVDGSGFWVEVAKYWSRAHDLAVFARFGSIDPNDDVDDDERDQITVGLVWPVADWHVRWGFEYRNISEDQTGGGSLDDDQVTVELMLNF
ncbi:MAG: hypothetical protein ACE5JH_12105 [Acidobacteriota bacterium]